MPGQFGRFFIRSGLTLPRKCMFVFCSEVVLKTRDYKPGVLLEEYCHKHRLEPHQLSATFWPKAR